MINNIKTKVAKFIKNFCKIKNLTEVILRKKRNLQRHIYTSKISTKDIIDCMKKIGLKEGATIFIHSSWNEFYNYNSDPEELINAILRELGEKGTLLMPAYPFLRKKSTLFNLRTTPTMAGLLAESFRTMPGVKRSINLQHSVCGIGPNADFLLNDHINSETCWDEHSPYYKLREVDAVVFNLGLGKYHIGTIMHCVESLLWKESEYFSQFFGKEVKYDYIDFGGVKKNDSFITAQDNFNRNFTINRHILFQKRFFNQIFFKRHRLSNLWICSCSAKYVIDRMVELGKDGFSYYSFPKPPKRFY